MLLKKKKIIAAAALIATVGSVQPLSFIQKNADSYDYPYLQIDIKPLSNLFEHFALLYIQNIE